MGDREWNVVGMGTGKASRLTPSYIYIYIHVCVCIYKYIYIYIYTCVCIYIYMCVYIYIYNGCPYLKLMTKVQVYILAWVKVNKLKIFNNLIRIKMTVGNRIDLQNVLRKKIFFLIVRNKNKINLKVHNFKL